MGIKKNTQKNKAMVTYVVDSIFPRIGQEQVYQRHTSAM